MSFFDWLRRLRDRAILEPLSPREFTAILQVKELSCLEEELARIAGQKGALSAGMLGLHDFRLVLFAPAENEGESQAAPVETPRALLFSLVFDGRVDDVLGDLFEAVPDTKSILCRCHGFETGNDSRRHFVRLLKKQRVRRADLSRRVGSLPFPNARSHAAAAIELHWKASRAELEEALGCASFPLPLTSVERSLPEEGRWALRAAEEMARRQASAARRSDGVTRRAAHAKTIGVLNGTFEVKPLPPEYRQGIFAEPRELPARIRLSNGSEDLKADGDRDARGLAIRVELPGSLGFDEELQAVLPNPVAGRQDFVLFSYPTFFASSVRRFVMLLGILRAQDWKQALRCGLFFLLSRAALRELVAAVGALSLRLRHSLLAEYHSGTAYRFGPDFVAKYSVMAAEPARFERLRAETGPDFLSSALRASLVERSIELRFYVRLLPVADLRFASPSIVDLVEDPTFDWDAFGAEKVHVATLSIGQGALDSVDQSQGEQLSFSIWNALRAHRPLGSLNRARFLAYPLSARRRGAALVSGVAASDNQRGVVPDAAE
jgi:hypothetical protein